MTDIAPPAALSAFRLSPQQRWVWISQPDGISYRAQLVARIDGSLRSGALEQAVNQVVERHEILRTHFPHVHGMNIPVQVISDRLTSWRIVDLSELDDTDRTDTVGSLIARERLVPLDFTSGPLIQALLITLDASQHLLLLTLPALCADSWSLRLIARDINHFYLGGEIGDDAPVQYLQFSEWQNEILDSEDEFKEAGCAYWQRVAADLPIPPLLQFETTSKDDLPAATTILCTELDKKVMLHLRQWGQTEEVTPGALLAACWHVLVGGLAGQTDVAIWTAVDGRKYKELHDAVGLFSSYVPIRSILDAGEGFRQIVRRISVALQGAVDAQEYYWGGAWSTTRVAPTASELGFAYEEWHIPGYPGGHGLSLLQTYSCIEPFKLQLSCMNSTDGLSLEFTYDTRRYREADIRRVADYYQVLLQNALQAPDAPISSLSMLPPLEREQILQEWNRTARAFPEVAAVHHLFEQHALAHPDSVALVFEDEQLTYSQLNARANRLAHLLQQRGVVPDRAVGLCLERGIDLIIGLLGILKAGGAYVPLDPTLPQERLCAMLQDSETTLWVSQASLASGLPGEGVLLDGDAALLDQYSADNPTSGVRSEHLVYVIYTSGSTGRPKGVGIEHRNLLNYVFGVGERLELGVGASYATVSTLSADLGHTTLFSSLCLGGCLHLISSDRAMDPLRWREYFTRYEIDCLKIVGSHLSALLGSGPVSSEMLPRKVLVLGGEACRWELVSRIQSGAPGLRVLNHYGPTETTVGVLTYEAERGVDGSVVGSATVPLGRPLGNSRVYVLNSYQEPVPVGVVGELYIGGSGVGRGYVDREELTSERFLRDPFREDASSRMYRTGDQCRYLSDGNIEFLGRVDHQVKIRGYRIELGEIESVLLEHGSVREAVVLAREEASGEKRLVGYVVCHEGSVSGSELQEYLRLRLPEYMVPGWIVELPRLPLTSNGKVDRSSLPEPEETGSGVEVVAARTAVEEVLLGIWEELLRRDGLGVHQNFFELGGHSLLATQVISRIRETFEVDVPLRALFEAPTVAGLAEHIDALHRAGAGLLVPPLTRAPREGDLPLSFSQQRLWFIDQLQPGSSLYNVPTALRMRGALDIGALHRALEEIFTRHEVLRTRYAAKSGNPIQVISEDTNFPLPLINLSDLSEDERVMEMQRLCREEANRPFNLAQDPMMRAQVLRLGAQEHLLLLTLHHIASDGWSKSIIVHELSRLYNAFTAGQPSPLAELPVQYADYAVWQRGWLQGEALQRQADYWRSRLSGAPPVLELPTDRSRETATSYEGAAHRFRAPSELSAELHKLCREGRATPFMALLTAFKVLLYRWTGQLDLVVGTDVANRTEPQTEGLIGFFLNHLVLRTDLGGDPSFRELLGRVREACLGAYAHQDLSFDKLVEVLQPERRMSHTPVFQVLFVVQNAPRGTMEWSGLEVGGIGSELASSKFDLSLFVAESGEGFGGAWVYRTDLFEARSISRLAEQYLQVLGQVLSNPNIAIDDVELIAEVDDPNELERERSMPSGIREARRKTAVVLSSGEEV